MRIRRVNIHELGYDEYADVPIVDVETIDSLQKRKIYDLRPSVVGIFYKDEIIQAVLKDVNNIDKFKEEVVGLLDGLPQPFLAFNKQFDRSVLKGFLGKSFEFEEIQEYRFQKKQKAKEKLGLEVYDPFCGDGFQAITEYEKYLESGDEKHLNFVVAHNTACLITEHLLYKNKK